ncbi:hypothetical protein [Brevibacillus porteri]|uniref:Uncharacterized protein n=1 Tax=Brevibacillus porteri TaxID=2126350 RepID=A0ABX5FS83_9BACL|nr:hypothetical protein [Brevibacillus porteri]MED1801804.1 hypothetical protein [Brevibacillus porteri]MED2134935.1 hypothetical protein [Brevibacillus porteri]MED2745457.1 hypothetical protein [Brevibacillus porteri]MED2815797.1 hypothetical protein [Brevibacillus porteri]MED2897635.1 hypothetical protein [Brevibacillus porteri]
MGTKSIPTPQQVEKVRKLIESMGLWEVDKIQIRYISDDWVQFSCEKKVINGPTEIRNVQRTLIDRIKGRSFDEKVERELQQFVSMLNSVMKRFSGSERKNNGSSNSWDYKEKL